jgi:hypothetical protein
MLLVTLQPSFKNFPLIPLPLNFEADGVRYRETLTLFFLQTGQGKDQAQAKEIREEVGKL